MLEEIYALVENTYALVMNWDTFFAAVKTAGAAALIVALVELFVDSKSSSIFKALQNRKSASIDLLFWLFHFTPVFSVILAVSTLGVLNIVKYFLHGVPFYIVQMEDGLFKFLLLFVAYDFVGYVAHRIMHANSFTWRFHAFHHSARSFNILTVHRVHPVDSAVIKFFQTLVVLLLGASVVEIFWFSFTVLLLGTIKHSNLIVNYPKPFNFLIQSPAQHWVHHSENSDHYDTNFGEILQIWDVIFGTHLDLPKEELRSLTIGTPDTVSFHDNLWELLIWPYHAAIKKRR